MDSIPTGAVVGFTYWIFRRDKDLYLHLMWTPNTLGAIRVKVWKNSDGQRFRSVTVIPEHFEGPSNTFTEQQKIELADKVIWEAYGRNFRDSRTSKQDRDWMLNYVSDKCETVPEEHK